MQALVIGRDKDNCFVKEWLSNDAIMTIKVCNVSFGDLFHVSVWGQTPQMVTTNQTYSLQQGNIVLLPCTLRNLGSKTVNISWIAIRRIIQLFSKNTRICHGLYWSHACQVSLFLTLSPSWTFNSLLEVGISLFLSLISYLSFSP